MYLEMAAALDERHRRTGDEGRNLGSGTLGHCPAMHTGDSTPDGSSEGAAGRGSWGGEGSPSVGESSGRGWVAVVGSGAAEGSGGHWWSPPGGVPEASWLSPVASRSGPLLSEKRGEWLLPPVLGGEWPFPDAGARGPSGRQKMGQPAVLALGSLGGSQETETLSELWSLRPCCGWGAGLACSAPTEILGWSLGSEGRLPPSISQPGSRGPGFPWLLFPPCSIRCDALEDAGGPFCGLGARVEEGPSVHERPLGPPAPSPPTAGAASVFSPPVGTPEGGGSGSCKSCCSEARICGERSRQGLSLCSTTAVSRVAATRGVFSWMPTTRGRDSWISTWP